MRGKTDLFVGLPGPVNDVQHAGLGRLGGGVEPGGGGQVQPGVRHEVRVVQEQPSVLKHGLAELAVVEVVTQLLRSSAVILLELALPGGTVNIKTRSQNC